ncbi:helix-turn-helix transcriptional regulator [Streptomyces sp. NPDC046821]|uniref:helix-turn-helix transcriptional regulator n=1 Tax=Streptomyces sp. NPDC046821 TaxID=3154702 RepID=UPI0033EFFEA3
MNRAEVDAEWSTLGLGPDELRVYEHLLGGGAPASRAALGRTLGITPRRVTAALDRLAAHGFTTPGSPLPSPVPPSSALRTLLHTRQAELHQRSAELERMTAGADRIAARLTGGLPGASAGGIETVTGRRAIAERVASLVLTATDELTLLDRPPYAVRSADDEPEPLDLTALVRRGVSVRVVVDREGLDYPGRIRSLNEMARDGIDVRIGTALPTKMITVDRRVTLLPPTDVGDPTASALVVGDALLRNALIPLFETVWERAMPVAPDRPDELTEEDRELLTLLTAGLKDEAIARRLGVHVHTARRRISRLLQTLNAETRFQAGVQALRRGWLTT